MLGAAIPTERYLFCYESLLVWLELRFFGHALGASGAVEAVVCLEALRRQMMPPNLGFSSLDPAIGLEPVTRLQSASLKHVMSNSFGFGGNCSSIVLSKLNSVA